MKIEKLTDNKIRIIISTEDLKEKNIDLHTFMAEAIESQTIFLEMLNQAEKEVGFVTKGCKLLIEAFSSMDGIFVFTITKYAQDVESSPTIKKKLVGVRRKTSNFSRAFAIYSFLDIEEFFKFCEFLSSSSISNISKLAKKVSLYLYKNTYYLVFNDINTEYPDLKHFFSSISEFGKIVSGNNVFERKLIEHGTIIFKKNALSNGIKYFCAK